MSRPSRRARLIKDGQTTVSADKEKNAVPSPNDLVKQTRSQQDQQPPPDEKPTPVVKVDPDPPKASDEPLTAPSMELFDPKNDLKKVDVLLPVQIRLQ